MLSCCLAVAVAQACIQKVLDLGLKVLSILLVWNAVFQPKLKKLQKNIKKGLFFNVFGQFKVVFEVYSILTEKQRTKAKNSNSVINFASLDMYVAPKLAIIVE